MFTREGNLIVLGVTDNFEPSFENYVQWIRRVAPAAQIVKLSGPIGNIEELPNCDGIILTGGGDIHPKFYGREDVLDLMEDLNGARDEFEFAVVRKALQHEIPVLGVCRGMQVFNVAMGGSMIPDVQKAGYEDHSKGPGGHRTHRVMVEQGTILHSLVGAGNVEINTSHHQAVDRIGRGLRVSARSKDGLIECMEWENPDEQPFALLVQWHPERMPDTESPAATGILEKFMQQIVEAKKVV